MTLNPASTRRFDRVLDTLWYAYSAPQTLMALTALLAGTLAFAAIFPQQPAGLEGTAADRWYTTVAAGYRGAGSFLQAIGAFNVMSGLWVRSLLAALAFNLALRMAAQLRFVHRVWKPARMLAAPSGLPLRHGTLTGPLEPALTHVETTLRDRFPRIVIEREAARAQLYAERRHIGALGPLLTYLGALLVLLGLLVNDTAGWRASDIALAPGGTAILVRFGGLQVMLNDISGEERGTSGVVTLEHGGASRIVRLSFTRPANWGNVWLSQQTTGPALAVTAQGSDLRPLPLQSLAPGGEVDQTLRILFEQTQGEQAFAIPARNLAFRAVSYPAMPDRGIQRPVFLVEGYRGADATPAISELVEDETTLTLENTSLTIRRDRYLVLEVAYLPGLLPLLFGILLALAGVLLSGFWGPVRAWVGMAAGQDVVAVALRMAAPVESGQEAVHLLQAFERAPVSAEPAHES